MTEIRQRLCEAATAPSYHGITPLRSTTPFETKTPS
jgi:hypothetical protein